MYFFKNIFIVNFRSIKSDFFYIIILFELKSINWLINCASSAGTDTTRNGNIISTLHQIITLPWIMLYFLINSVFLLLRLVWTLEFVLVLLFFQECVVFLLLLLHQRWRRSVSWYLRFIIILTINILHFFRLLLKFGVQIWNLFLLLF